MFKKLMLLSIIIFAFYMVSVMGEQYKGTYISNFASNSTGGETSDINCAVYVEAKCKFSIQPPDGEVWDIHRMILNYGVTGLVSTDDYGSIAGGLTNGIRVITNAGGVDVNLTNQQPVQTNGDWSKYMYDIQLLDWGAGQDEVVGRWTFANGGTVLRLNGSNNESIDVLIRDNLASLAHQNFLFQGYVYNENETATSVKLTQSEVSFTMPLAIIISLGLAAGLAAYLSSNVKLDMIPRGRMLEKAALHILGTALIPVLTWGSYVLANNSIDYTYLSSMLLTVFLVSVLISIVIAYSYLQYILEHMFGFGKEKDDAEVDN